MKKEDLRIIKTRASLYRSLITLLKTKSFEEIKIPDICNKSNINRSTFYDHFKDKNELLEAYINDLKIELEQFINNKNDFLELIELLLEYLDKNINTYKILLKIKNNSNTRDMLTEVILNSLSDNLDNNTKLFYTNGSISIIIEALNNNAFNKDELLQTITSLVQKQKKTKTSL